MCNYSSFRKEKNNPNHSVEKERFLDVGIYLDLLLKILDVVHGQIQHVGSVGLLQSSTITGRIRAVSLSIVGCSVQSCDVSLFYRSFLGFGLGLVTFSMLGTSSCNFRIRSLIFVLLTWQRQRQESVSSFFSFLSFFWLDWKTKLE